MNKHIYYFLLCLCFLFSCKKKQERAAVDFDQIKQKKELTIITLYSSTSYFI